MQLPNRQRAVVPTEKITHYLLDPTHPQGQSKARLFHRMGFRREAPDVSEVTELPNEFGTKFVGEGFLVGPTGLKIRMISVWIIRNKELDPWFVTAYPAHERRET